MNKNIVLLKYTLPFVTFIGAFQMIAFTIAYIKNLMADDVRRAVLQIAVFGYTQDCNLTDHVVVVDLYVDHNALGFSIVLNITIVNKKISRSRIRRNTQCRL